MTQAESSFVDVCWSKFWKTIIESDSLNDNKDSYRKTFNDLVVKSLKMRSSALNLGTLIGKKGDEAETDQRVKELIKFSMEYSQAVHQDCIKTLTFN